MKKQHIIGLVLLLCGVVYLFFTKAPRNEFQENTPPPVPLEVIQSVSEIKPVAPKVAELNSNQVDIAQTDETKLIISKGDPNRISAYNPAFEAYRNKEVKTFTEYFEKDTRESEWATDTELRFRDIYSDRVFQEKYTDYPIHQISCKDTVCQLSLIMNSQSIPLEFEEHFRKVPNSTEYHYLRAVLETDNDGITYIYIFREM